MEEFFDVLDENGVFTGEVASREKCHSEGLRHKAVVAFVVNSKEQVLLQKRSASKKLWPNMWDVTSGGHVLTGELGFEAAIREAKEELDLELKRENMIFLGSGLSKHIKGDIINNHMNEYYIVEDDIDETKLKLQEEEVSSVKWIDREEIETKIKNNYDGITDKTGCWEYLLKYYEWLDKKKR